MSRNCWKILAALVLTGLPMGQLHAADGLYLGAGIGAASFKDDLESGGRSTRRTPRTRPSSDGDSMPCR